MVKEAIILAGGLGTRLRKVLEDIPKPMAPIQGVPFLKYLFWYLKTFPSIEKLILSVSYKKEIVMDYFGSSYEGFEVEYAVEETPLGTGGAIKNAFKLVKGNTALVLNGDTLFKVDLAEFVRLAFGVPFHIAIALKPIAQAGRYGSIELTPEGRIKSFKEKEEQQKALINGGMYLVKKEVFDLVKTPDKFSFEKDFLEKYLDKLRVYGFVFDSYFIDIGIPEDYERAKKELPKILRPL